MSTATAHRPFSRIGIVIKLMAAAMQSTNPQLALLEVPAYKSRGHGRGKRVKKTPPNRSKYMPHQGPRECARRVLQMQAAARV